MSEFCFNQTNIFKIKAEAVKMATPPIYILPYGKDMFYVIPFGLKYSRSLDSAQKYPKKHRAMQNRTIQIRTIQICTIQDHYSISDLKLSKSLLRTM